MVISLDAFVVTIKFRSQVYSAHNNLDKIGPEHYFAHDDTFFVIIRHYIQDKQVPTEDYGWETSSEKHEN